MDRHAMMWNEATRDLDAEHAERALAYALADLTGVRDFTHAAASATEYGHRAALTADTVARTAAAHGTTVAAVNQALHTSFGHVLAARTAAAAKTAKTAVAAPPQQQDPRPPATPTSPPPPGAPADILTGDTTAKTSKPRTLPTGAAPAPMPPMPPGPSAGPTPAPGAATAPAQRTASRRQIIEADIAALNPHLPAATITRLASAAMRHLSKTRRTAAEPLAYGNWENPEDGPITRTVKDWQPGGKKTPAGGASGHVGDGPDGAPDPAPAGPAAAADVAEEALPLLAAASRR